jgi:hypothetical protein
MWTTMLSFHWSIRHQQPMTLANTCLKMVARAMAHFVTVRCEIAAACCLLKRSTFGGILHFRAWQKSLRLVSSCCLLKRSTFGVVFVIWIWEIYFCSVNTVKRWKPLDAVWLVIHADAVASLCRMIKMHALSIQLLKSNKFSEVVD